MPLHLKIRQGLVILLHLVPEKWPGLFYINFRRVLPRPIFAVQFQNPGFEQVLHDVRQVVGTQVEQGGNVILNPGIQYAQNHENEADPNRD